MNGETDVKARVQEFYDSVGWRSIGEGLYQNARYEDLRPVSQEYLHRCHLRVARHLPARGDYLLDAGSGPIQYPEYLEYSKGFRRRVCLDISMQALAEARKRVGAHGLFVVGDVAQLPFKSDAFDGVVSLHTVHHLPLEEQEAAFRGFARVARPGGRVVVVYSWGRHSELMRALDPAIGMAAWLLRLYRRARGLQGRPSPAAGRPTRATERLLATPGTYTFKHDQRWAREHLGDLPGFEVRVWRAVNTAFLRAFIHRRFFGRFWLRALYALEEGFPYLLGRIGQYPLILYGPAAEGTS